MLRKFIRRKEKFYICLICGYNRLPRPLYNEKGVPEVGLICACCAFQPGFDDEELGWTIEAYREDWLEKGAIWFDSKAKPKYWDLGQQLANIDIKE